MKFKLMANIPGFKNKQINLAYPVSKFWYYASAPGVWLAEEQSVTQIQDRYTLLCHLRKPFYVQVEIRETATYDNNIPGKK